MTTPTHEEEHEPEPTPEELREAEALRALLAGGGGAVGTSDALREAASLLTVARGNEMEGTWFAPTPQAVERSLSVPGQVHREPAEPTMRPSDAGARTLAPATDGRPRRRRWLLAALSLTGAGVAAYLALATGPSADSSAARDATAQVRAVHWQPDPLTAAKRASEAAAEAKVAAEAKAAAEAKVAAEAKAAAEAKVAAEAKAAAEARVVAEARVAVPQATVAKRPQRRVSAKRARAAAHRAKMRRPAETKRNPYGTSGHRRIRKPKANLYSASPSTYEDPPALPNQLSESTVRVALERHQADFIRCGKWKKLRAVQTEFVILPSGRVASANVTSGSDDDDLKSCVVAVLKAVRHERFAGPEMTVNIPLPLKGQY